MNFRTSPPYPNHPQPISPLHPPAKARTFPRLLNSRQGLGHLNSSTCGPKFREAQSQPADRLHWPGSWRLNRLNRMQQTQHDSTDFILGTGHLLTVQWPEEMIWYGQMIAVNCGTWASSSNRCHWPPMAFVCLGGTEENTSPSSGLQDCQS